MDDQQLQILKRQLLALKNNLLDHLELSEGAGQTVTLDQTTVGRLSRMDAIQQQQMSQANRAQYRRRIQNIDRALVAMATDEYGCCDTCGDDINPERLNISPESLYCLSCQEVQEN